MDVSVLYAVADRMDEVAGVLRARVAHIALGSTTTHWYSPAGRIYFARIEEITAQLSECAVRVGELAERVRLHAARILANLP